MVNQNSCGGTVAITIVMSRISGHNNRLCNVRKVKLVGQTNHGLSLKCDGGGPSHTWSIIKRVILLCCPHCYKTLLLAWRAKWLIAQPPSARSSKVCTVLVWWRKR